MKTSKINIKNSSKVLLFLSILLSTSYSSFAQNKLVSLINFVVPVICVVGLAVFLVTTFLKQKNH